ncbi:DUF4153 domain-containing protein [Algoriphagus pacificus]|uniref:DUF4153 domain-containing protein n=1 Tax=Algoriphagus pacificus TaxID=2811234 RepID=A0ABS3CJ18_9BACT|nr:DUF4153 domain-containing protein [Algoriphagus pacificus]MBN7817098.1 DUF4153 domain-containing protein [Algoriphagus pacificus]
MKFPSISQLKSDAENSFLRFPLSIVSAALGSFLLIYLIEIDLGDQNLEWINLLITFALGIPLFFCVDIYAEKKELEPSYRIIGRVLALVILIIIYFSFPKENTFSTTRVPYIRYLVYNLTAHLLVSFIGYWKEKEDHAFWKFNESLFLRIALGALYSFVLYIGIALALGAIHLLFSLEIDPKTYFQIYILIIGVFNTWFFLAGVPKNQGAVISQESYPKGLKVFTQFILIPLLLVYLTILYFYGGKIILTWDWPKGIVSYMIIAISVLGIFTYLLLFPIRDQKESSWIKTFYRAFYFLLFPLIVLLFLAIGIRVQEYGLTVNRYIILLMGIWLTFIALYFIFGKGKIKTIPISLAAFMIFGSFGPWSMFSLSESNQLSRLETILKEHQILSKEKIKNEVYWEFSDKGKPKAINSKNTNQLEKEQLEEVNSIIQYLEDYHGLGSVLNWFDQDLATLYKEAIKAKEDGTYTYLDYSQFIVESMGLKYIPNYMIGQENSLDGQYFSYNIENDKVRILKGYDFEIRFNFNPGFYKDNWDVPGFEEATLSFDPETNFLNFKIGNSNAEFDLASFVSTLRDQYGNGYKNDIPKEDLTLSYSDEDIELKILFTNIQNNNSEESIVEDFSGVILIGIKN